MDGAQLVPEPARNGLVAVQQTLEFALAKANDLHSLQDLENQVVAVQAYVQQLDLALREQNRIAETRLRIARKIGTILQATVQRGGKGSKLPPVTSIGRGGSPAPLPDCITRIQSHRYQRLARIPEDHLDRYIAECAAAAEVVTPTELLRRSKRWSCASEPRPKPERAGRRTTGRGLGAVWEATIRLMNVDFAVGVPARVVRAAAALQPKDLGLARGNVAGIISGEVDEALDPLFDRSRVDQLLLVLPAETRAAWFRRIGEPSCACCFLGGPGVPRVVLYRGERRHGFWLAFRQLGSVVEGVEY